MPDTALFSQPFRPLWRLAAMAPLLAAMLLTGCGSREEKFAPACPALKLLPEAADITRTRGQGSDPTDLLVRGRITQVPASCKEAGRSAVSAEMKVGFNITRGPSVTNRQLQLPYLVTVMLGDAVLDQKSFYVTADFPPNVDEVNVYGDDVNLRFPVGNGRNASDYTIYVSFQLTSDELAANRRQHR